MRNLGLIAAMSLSCATAVRAQEAIEMPIAQVLALAAQPFLDRDRFQSALSAAVPGLRLDTDIVDPPILDPYLWAMAGSFGPNGTRAVPGAIFACARYGLGTRDYFAEQGFSTRDAFRLMGQTIPQPDDAEHWPEGAVARLYCSFVWDDERVVVILDEAPARTALARVFDQVLPIVSTGNLDGYRLDAQGGAIDTVTHVDSAHVILTQGHQSVAFRSYLMGGGS